MLALKENALAEDNSEAAYNRELQNLSLALFGVSPLKLEKWKQLYSMSGPVADKTCLDIGSDNGVISYLFRTRCGGTWHSVDLIPETVAAIKSMVGERVEQMQADSLPFETDMFDQVVVVDMLEHVEDDRALAVELLRVLKPGGVLILNVPCPREGVWRRFKALIGQTDAAHGHVRPGYTMEQLRLLLGDAVELENSNSYSRFFSDLIDTAITAALSILKGRRGKKGTVITGQDLKKLRKSFKLYRVIAPVILLFAKLDSAFPFLHGNMLVARFRKKL